MIEIKEYFNDLYLKLLKRPKSKFKNRDIVELNEKGIKLGIKIDKSLKVYQSIWIFGGYVVFFYDTHINESISEEWLKLKE